MIRYLFLFCIYIPFYLLAMLLAPVLPLFARLRNGPIDNANGEGVEPRLPAWLFWFDTSTDNSLWGDHGWRTKHCPRYWQSYIGEVLWLWRNPAAGFCWSVLSRRTFNYDRYTVSHSGNGLDVDKGQGKYGWYFIRCARDGAFSLRWCKQIGPKVLSFEAGWLLDVYVKDAQYAKQAPLATFQFQPQIKTAKA